MIRPWDAASAGNGSSWWAPVPAAASWPPGSPRTPTARSCWWRPAPTGRRPGCSGPNFLAALAEPGRIWPEPVVVRGAYGQAAHPYLRGRGVGGSSAVNALIAQWGTVEDHRSWVAAGAVGWGWRDTAAARARVDARVPAWLPPTDTWSPLERALAEAATTAGHPWCPDPRRPATLGAGPVALTVRDGRRCSAADAYLTPARQRPDLEVRTDALVDRLLLEGRRVVGVHTVDGGELIADDVVLCAGAIGSPVILLRSGIDRPGLGARLADHPSAGFTLALHPAARLADVAAVPLASQVRYSSGLAGGGPADMQLLPLSATAATSVGLATGGLQAAVMHTYSRGSLRLEGDDPLAPPRVDLGLLSDRRDLVRLRDGVARLRALLDDPALGRLVEGVYVDDRGTPVETLDAEDAIDAWLVGRAGDYVHLAGSCHMGPPEDAGAVVDPTGRVIGYGGLRVADASILPSPPRAGTHLSAMLVGEVVADAMRRDS